jgi:hypothetical protein
VLSGHFLWHDALADIDADYRSRARELMQRHRPLIIATALFAAPALAGQGRVVPVGLFRAAPRATAAERSDLLVSAGTGVPGFAALDALVGRLLAGGRPPFERVYIEPRLMPAAPPAWLAPAPYTPEMYAGTLAAICRPGIGTLTDCLLSGVRVFAIGESGNEEMRTNVERLRAAGLGDGFDDAQEALRAASGYRQDRSEQRQFHERISVLPDAGAAEAADCLLAMSGGVSVRTASAVLVS